MTLATEAGPTDAGTTHQRRPVSLAAWVALVAVIVVGIALRLVWLDDIEYKADEAWTWRHALAAGRTEPISWVGMPTSAGPENPGMSLWVFIPLRWLGGEPRDLALGVAWLSIAAIVVLVGFAWVRVPPAELEMWLWAGALYAVNPVSVLHHRKVWPPCVFPLLVSLFLACWWYRERRLGAFCWGALGSVVAQINLSAAFFAAGFALWSWLADRSRIAWKSWLAGSALASLPLVPWLLHVATVSTQPRLTTLKWTRILEGKFALRWITEPFGLGLDHALGDDYIDFLRQPVVAGTPTWLVGVLHLVALLLGLIIAWRASMSLRRQRPGWREVLVPAGSPTGLACNAAFWGYGILLTLTCLPMHRQYMIIVYPIEMLWVAYAALSVTRGDGKSLRIGRQLLAGLVVAQLLLSASFLSYVHVKQVIHGDYGVALGSQPSQPNSRGP